MIRFLLLVSAGALFAFGSSAATNRVETTMVVQRCQAVDGDGHQCTSQVEKGTKYCWRHRGFAKAFNETMDDAGKGASESWRATKQWSTNAWRKTKTGAKNAWDATVEAADSARVGLVELLGGKDDDKKSKSK